MPVDVPVPDLLSLTMCKTADIITKTLSTGLNEFPNNENIIQIIQSYLSEVPIYIKEELLHHILEFEDDSTTRYKALKIMLCPQMKTLRTNIFPETYYNRVASVIESQGLNLESLDLRGVWLKGNLNCKLRKILENLNNVQVLHIPHVATDGVLETIGQSDPPLKFLDMRGECNITSEGIKLLCCSTKSLVSQNLHVVLLGNPSGIEVSPENVTLLIKYLPNLQSLGSYPKVRQSLEFLVNEMGLITTNLLNVHDSYTDINSINLLIKTCPSLKSIYLDHPCQGVIPQLAEFTHLNKAKFNRFQVSDLCSFIDKTGQKLSTIELMFGTGSLDISYLSQFCINLESFICYQMDCLRQLGQIEFNKLRYIEICNSNITLFCVKSILIGSPNVEKISFGDVLEITDDDIIEIYTSKEFSNLQSIWFPNAINLTSNSIQILMSCCPNLITLGVISGWNVTQEEAFIIQKEIQSENLALKLIDYFLGY